MKNAFVSQNVSSLQELGEYLLIVCMIAAKFTDVQFFSHWFLQHNGF